MEENLSFLLLNRRQPLKPLHLLWQDTAPFTGSGPSQRSASFQSCSLFAAVYHHIYASFLMLHGCGSLRTRAGFRKPFGVTADRIMPCLCSFFFFVAMIKSLIYKWVYFNYHNVYMLLLCFWRNFYPLPFFSEKKKIVYPGVFGSTI